MPTDTEVEAAIETVARHAMASMVEVICDCWESYPEVAELDWERVAERVATLAPYPPAADYQAAYKLLAGRADNEC